MFNKFFSREEGQGLVEYALILVLVAIVVIAILMLLGPQINQVFCRVVNVLQPGECDTGVITIVSGPTANDQSGVGSGPYDVAITVSVAEATDVTFTAGGVSSATTNCNTTCSFTVTTTQGSGSYTISTGSLGSKSGTY